MAKQAKKKSNFIFILIFLLGFGVLIYPQISRLYYRVQSSQSVGDFDQAKKDLSQEEIDRRMELARAFNASLNNHISQDPYSDEKVEEAKKEYAKMLELREQIGHIKIPKINVDLPTYAGTSEEVLQKGAGHLEGTSLPIGGNSSHSVITAHSGLPKARLFTDLSKLRVGDKFYFHNLEGVLAYQVDQVKIVEPDNFDDLLIVEGHDYMTLLTCTPIMVNSHRLLVRGHRVDYIPLEEQRLTDQGLESFYLKYLFYLVVFLIVLMIGLNIHFTRKKKAYVSAYLGKKEGQEIPGKISNGGKDHGKKE